MGDLQNTSAEGTQAGTEGKTFTQEDVNRIVQERLAKERSKASNNEELEKRTAELDKRAADLEAKENRFNTLSVLRSAGYPDELADVIKCGSAEELKKSMEVIDKIIKERTPDSEDEQSQENRAVFNFTQPLMQGGKSDNIRKAMGLRG